MPLRSVWYFLRAAGDCHRIWLQLIVLRLQAPTPAAPLADATFGYVALMLLSCTVEWLIVRHYGLAAVFIMPLMILLAEVATLDPQVSHALIQSRFMDTVLDCVAGVLGGVVMPQPRLRAAVGQWLRALLPVWMRRTG